MDSPLFRAVCQGNLSKLDSLLLQESINVQDDRGRSLLHWAIGCQQKEVFHHLIQEGINVRIADHEGYTPMHVAIRFGNEAHFQALWHVIPNDPWVKAYGTSLLETAILAKHKGIVSQLLEKGVEVNQPNQRGSTPIEIAARINAPDIYDLLVSFGADENSIRKITPTGPYMGQPPPGKNPVLFAPNFISTEESEFGSVFNAAGTTFYFAVDVQGKSEIRYTKLVDDQWTTPRILLAHEKYGYNDPFLSNDESQLYFISKRAMDGVGQLKDVDIWYIQQEGEGWSEPIHAGPTINTTGNEYYISFTDAGTMYFSSNSKAPPAQKRTDYDIFYSKSIDGIFQNPVVLDSAINTPAYEADVFVAPDESYLIFCSTRENGFGQGDLYLSFKKTDGTWTTAINMGHAINTPYYEYCPFVTKDGKYLFYTSNQDIYWVSTSIINDLKVLNDKH